MKAFIHHIIVILKYTLSQLISVYNSERIIKIGQYLPKLYSNEKGSSFSDSQCIHCVPKM